MTLVRRVTQAAAGLGPPRFDSQNRTSSDKTKVRAVFQGPKGGIYYPTPRGKRMLTDEDYVKMGKADVFARIAAYEAFMASQGKG